jgi:DNA uptake protein ComE-like DNA-binding protein
MKGMTALTILAAGVITAACTTDSSKAADTAAVASAAATPVDSAAMPAPAAAAPAGGGMLDPNSASATDLAGVAGITSEIASAVVAGRPYSDMTGVDAVLAKSLTEQQRDSVYTRVWMPIDLNKASAKEILLIPGVGPRMRHEFEEYRPYTSIEQFRREIGKYVDKDEVARLERYVRI